MKMKLKNFYKKLIYFLLFLLSDEKKKIKIIFLYKFFNFIFFVFSLKVNICKFFIKKNYLKIGCYQLPPVLPNRQEL